jgi:type II secretory pathway pseudopilin PulG
MDRLKIWTEAAQQAVTHVLSLPHAVPVIGMILASLAVLLATGLISRRRRRRQLRSLLRRVTALEASVQSLRTERERSILRQLQATNVSEPGRSTGGDGSITRIRTVNE